MYQYKRRDIRHLVQRALFDTPDGIIRTILCKKLLPISRRQEAELTKDDSINEKLLAEFV